MKTATLIVWSWGTLTHGKSDQAYLPAEEYIIHMMNALRSGTNTHPMASANRNGGLITAVQRALAGCRWELLQEGYVTLGKLLEIDPRAIAKPTQG